VASNRIAILKARAKARKDPFNKAVRGTKVNIDRVPCPNSTCEHPAMLHDEVTDDLKPKAVSVRCTACDCREIRWPDEEKA
jgi:hypothetical protein